MLKLNFIQDDVTIIAVTHRLSVIAQDDIVVSIGSQPHGIGQAH